MPSLWRVWDERVKSTGRPSVVAGELNDLELLTLLSASDPHRDAEKRMLRQEAYRRICATQRTRGPAVEPRSAEPDEAASRPEAFSRLPTRSDYVDSF